jgi:hypothetical protein
MAKCSVHPARESVTTIARKNYCQTCKDGQEAAAKQVALTNRHVEPKDCFVTYRGGDMWVPFTGTGCAHWVAHQLGISNGPDWNQCLVGRTIRVPDVVFGKNKVSKLEDIKKNDIWANDSLNHTGLVTDVKKDAKGVVQILITHDSSGQGGVSTNDFRTYFHGQGSFYR